VTEDIARWPLSAARSVKKLREQLSELISAVRPISAQLAGELMPAARFLERVHAGVISPGENGLRIDINR